jgi:protocatechuate 3,4-dioxygenase beta subunit
MILEIEKKLKRRKPSVTAITTTAETISTTKRAILIALSITAAMTTYMTFISLPQSSFAQTAATTTNAMQNATLPPIVGRPCTLTESTGQGPEYLPGPPLIQGQDFAKGIPGPRLIVTGEVLNAINCKPVQGAVLNIWQANSTGDYDYKGYNLRGKIVTDKEGNYVLNTIYPHEPKETIQPRPSHIHVIVGVPGQPQITTQVYFEVYPRDFLVKDSLITLPEAAANGTKIAHFNFVVEDFRGFDITKGLVGNPTLAALLGQGSNK